MPTPVPIIGHFHWDQRTHSLHPLTEEKGDTGGDIKRLTNKQQALLSCLYTASPSPVPNHIIVKTVWGSGHISAESLPQLISRTRQILDDKKKSIIINHPGHGYSLSLTSIDTPEQDGSTEAVPESVISYVDEPATPDQCEADLTFSSDKKHPLNDHKSSRFKNVIKQTKWFLLNPTIIFLFYC
ncbi:hypothetical protein JCM19237_2383 [Photobacterium aphoticum]|uniref:OmpR/PhoB-type domain-containing protein n=1 Tax=Photobacterium aphoticum TaxID=754436 RepID=A0A090R9E7_9GAMM|nr:hypothetical protein JCM19237_2383 [Photobacterium aphoticum]